VVVGVSERDDNLARNIVANLIEFDYPGALYLVGRQAGQLFGRPIVASLDQVPDGVDVAAMLVPAASTPELIEACGLPLAGWGLATDTPQALNLAARMGYPLAVKIVSADISHKSDVGCVVVNVADERALGGVVDDMLSRLSRSARVEGVLLQKMADGQQVILGGRRAPSFGPVVMFGLGGIYAELLADVSFRLAPLARCEAEAMIDEVKAGQLLRGLRGQPPADRAAVVDGLLRLSRLMCDAPQIAEVDVNPLIVSERGALVVDARVRVGA
ncbi:MAG: acetate--CoA ligase family protein, partial [Thermoflexales bacterium]|nr:acetate--CoA ligase family protein [Thermoflexales bacterium]